MKKITTLFFLCSLLVGYVFTRPTSVEQFVVAQNHELEAYEMFYVWALTNKFTTHNIQSFLSSDTMVLELCPTNVKKYCFGVNGTLNDKNIQEYQSYYESLMKRNVIYNNPSRIYFQGSSIKIMKVIMLRTDLEKLTATTDGIKYSNYFDFQY